MRPNIYSGKLIAICGSDGSGKSTQAKMLLSWFSKLGLPSIHTHEPTSLPIGSFIRDRILQNGEIIHHTQEAMLFAADRIIHLASIVIPALRRGVNVISDRYIFSSMAYQSRTVEKDLIWRLNAFAIKPNIAFLLDVPPELGIQRKGSQLDRFEEHIELQYIVRDNYLQLVEEGHLIRVNAVKHPQHIREEIVEQLLKRKIVTMF